MKQRRAQKPSALPPSAAPFLYVDYVQSKETLKTALRGPCFYGLVTGNSGMGKTCLLRQISTELDGSPHQIVYLSSSQASVMGIVRLLAHNLHVTPRRCCPETVQLLCQAISARTTHLVLWIDEADQVQPPTLQEVRMLAEANPATTQTFSVVLCGLPALSAKLDAPFLFPLKRRITVRCALNGLRRQELDSFLEHRFGTTDAQRVPPSVRDDLFERTQATPALIDHVVRCALKQTKGGINVDLFRSILDSTGL